MSDEFTPQEQALIERLNTAPQRRLSAAAKDAILQRMLAQVGTPPKEQRANIRRFYFPALAAAAIIALSLGGLVLTQYPNTPSSATAPLASASGPVTSVTAVTTITGILTPATLVPTPTTSLVESPLPSQAVAFSLNGVVQAIAGNVVTVNQTQVTLAANDPILKTIHVGDTVQIDGSIDAAGKLFASAVQINARENNSSVSVDGIVQAINNNVVTINGIQIQLPADYPGLASIKVGTFLSVDGYFRSNGTTLILIVIDVTVVPTAEVPTFEKCRTPQPAMGMDVPPAMGPPDAMGMGDPGMSVPAPPAMGMSMGEPAMGADKSGCN